MKKHSPKNKYLIINSNSVIIITVLTLLFEKLSVNALPKTNASNLFHFPDAQDSDLRNTPHQQNIHRIIFGADENNSITSSLNDKER